MELILPCIYHAIMAMPDSRICFPSTPEAWELEASMWMTDRSQPGGDPGTFHHLQGAVGAIDGTLINVRIFERGEVWNQGVWYVLVVCPCSPCLCRQPGRARAHAMVLLLSFLYPCSFNRYRRSRKGPACTNVLAVCDHRLMFTALELGAGAVHCSYMC